MVSFRKILLYSMVSSIVFALGRTYGYIQCRDRYKADYELQETQVDWLKVKANSLSATYDSIKKSPCYNKKP